MPQEPKNESWDRQLDDALRKALDDGKYDQLKDFLQSTTKTVLKSTVDIGTKVGKELTDAFAQIPKQERKNSASQVVSRYTTQWPPASKKAKPFKKKHQKSTGELVFTILLGTALLGFFGQRFYLYFIGAMPNFANISWFSLVFRCVFSLWPLAIIGEGISGFFSRRYVQYYNAIAGRPVCSLSVLENATGRSHKAVVKDLKRMIARGKFPQGHLDDDERCIIIGDEIYAQYRIGQQNRLLSEQQQTKIAEDPNSLDAVILKGENWISQIREINHALPEEEISKKLYDLENITARIFACVQSRPEKLGEINKFMNYYLPTTVKLVRSYQELDAQPIQGENIQTAKKEILEILDTVNYAFASLLDNLFGAEAIDISTDIAVLKNMLAREGLTEPAFRVPPQEEQA